MDQGMDAATTFAATPCNRWLGLQLVHRSPERAIVAMPVRPDLVQEAGVVQGGLLTALADTAAVWLLWPDLAPTQTMTGVDCCVHFLAAGRPDGGSLIATAVPVRIGGTIAVAETRVEQDGRQLAKATFTFLLRPRRQA